MSKTFSMPVGQSVRCSALAALALAVLQVGSAKADCRLSIQPVQDQWLVTYDAFDQNEVVRSFDVALLNQGDAVCSGSLSVNLRGDQFGLQQIGDLKRVPYALIEDSAGTDLTPRSGVSTRQLNARPINLAVGERSLVRFTFAASPDELVSAGLYSQDVLISLRDDSGLPLAERRVSLAVNVLPVAVMGLKGAFQRRDGVATINLGELVSGLKMLDTTLYVLSTGGYSVTVSSQNRGELRHSVGDWAISYRLRIGDRGMSLSAPQEITVSSNQARLDDYPLAVNIGAVDDRRAGNYSDTLTFTVSAL